MPEARSSHTFAMMKPPKFHSHNAPDWMRTCRLCLSHAYCLDPSSGLPEAGVSMRRTSVTSTSLSKIHRENPLEVVEHLATSQLWDFERASDDALNVVVQGKWANYRILFAWMNDTEALHLACSFELEDPARSNAEIEHLIPMINSQLWVRSENPLEVVEHLATSQLWDFERASDDALNVVVQGKWANYRILFAWMNDTEALHLACSFELEDPARSNAEIEHLIPMINSQLWV